jgi:hypothetical protein
MGQVRTSPRRNPVAEAAGSGALNPSIERTGLGKPSPAAHVERWTHENNEMSPKGRLYQDANFVVTDLDGFLIEHLVGTVYSKRPSPDDEPIVIYLKAQNQAWQRFFLDAWIGFWEDCGEDVIAEEEKDDEIRFVDYAAMFEIRGKKIISIACINSQICIAIEKTGTVVLALVEPEKDDNKSKVVFKKCV